MEKKRNEELQSRREFFKSAAKVALPVIGAVLLSNAPAFAQVCRCTSLQAPSGPHQGKNCGYTCSGGCVGSCEGTCSATCRGECRNSCYVCD